MDRKREQLIKKLSDKHKVSVPVVEMMVNSQFRFVATTMREAKKTGIYPVIMLPKFGKFAPSIRKIKSYESFKSKENNSSLLELPVQNEE